MADFWSGPREAGKSTLARHLSGNRGRYYTFDDLATLAAANADPAAFVQRRKQACLEKPLADTLIC